MLGRLGADGALQYLSYIGGTTGDTWVSAVTTDASGNVYVAGRTTSPNLPTTAGAYDRTCGDDGDCVTYKLVGFANRYMDVVVTDGFVMKLTAAADRLVYCTYVGGRDNDSIVTMAVDSRGRVHLGGNTISDDFPVTPNALQKHFVWVGNQDQDPYDDAFYSRLSADGSTLEYSTYLGGSGPDGATAVAVDAHGTGFLVGITQTRDFPTMNAFQPQMGDPQGPYVPYDYSAADAWIASFDDAGTRFSSYLGGSMGDSATGVAVTDDHVYVAGATCSPDFPGGASSPCTTNGLSQYLADLRADGSGVARSVLPPVGASTRFSAIVSDASKRVFAAGWRSVNGNLDAYLAVIPMWNGSSGTPEYTTVTGGADQESAVAVALDGNGGVFFGGLSQGSTDKSFVAHLQAGAPASSTSGDIVLYARDATAVAGQWSLVGDTTAAAGIRLWNPDGGVAKLPTASATPSSYFEQTFSAQAGVPYHLWLRMKADNDNWTNDSVFVQFSDSVDASGNPAWRIGTSGATVVSLEDCSGCGEHGWGWNDNGYDSAGQTVAFATSGLHTIRIQQREDGISVDQVVLSSNTWMTAAPGSAKDDTHILAQSPNTPPPPPPPPPNDPKEVVLYVAGDQIGTGQNWLVVADDSAAGGARLYNPDHGVPKSSSPSSSGNDYFEVTFTAEAGQPYHLWVRSRALDDYYGNDSVMVQFSGSVDANGSPIYRIGTNSSTNVILEDCSGCFEQGWGWTDNAYGAWAAPIYFATSGPQTIRVLRREDGISIDQIVLSSRTFTNSPPGAAKNDTTIVRK